MQQLWIAFPVEVWGGAAAGSDLPFVACGQSESLPVNLDCGAGCWREALPRFVVSAVFRGEPAAELRGVDPAEVAGDGIIERQQIRRCFGGDFPGVLLPLLPDGEGQFTVADSEGGCCGNLA